MSLDYAESLSKYPDKGVLGLREVPTTYQPHTNPIPTTHQPHTNHVWITCATFELMLDSCLGNNQTITWVEKSCNYDTRILFNAVGLETHCRNSQINIAEVILKVCESVQSCATGSKFANVIYKCGVNCKMLKCWQNICIFSCTVSH